MPKINIILRISKLFVCHLSNVVNLDYLLIFLNKTLKFVPLMSAGAFSSLWKKRKNCNQQIVLPTNAWKPGKFTCNFRNGFKND